MTDDCTPASGGDDAAEAADPAGLAERLRLTLVRLGRQLRRDDPPGLTITLYSALSTVVDHGELAIGELAEAEGVPASAATRIADRLEQAGLVTRRANPHDRRGVNVAGTAEGRRLVEDRRQRGNAWLAARLAGLTPEQRQTLADALGVLDAAVSPDGGSCAAVSPDGGSCAAVDPDGGSRPAVDPDGGSCAALDPAPSGRAAAR